MTAELLRWVFFISLALFLVGVVATPLMLAAIPEDYFIKNSEVEQPVNVSFVRIILLLAKNLLGILLVIAGILMLVLPGQGILTIIIGLLMLNFPGKRRLILKSISRPSIYRAVNWIREKQHKNPLQLPGHD